VTKIKIADEGAVRTIALSNPARRNAIGAQMVDELATALSAAREDAGVRVVVITGDAEGKAFCAGGDFAQFGTEAAKHSYADLLLAMVKYDKPIVARVNGAAMGGGLGIVAASTYAVATRDAKLGTPEIDVGLFPMMIMAVLARVVPRRALLEMMLFGQKLSADEARALGIVNRVVDAGELDAAVSEVTTKLTSKSGSTIALGLRAFAEQDGKDIAESLPILEKRLAECLATEDAREGLSAFLEKRPAVWKGR
jgi:enoyl-CoA hydratase/carnithine racemase